MTVAWSVNLVARAAVIGAIALGSGAAMGYYVSREPPPPGPRTVPSASAAAPPEAPPLVRPAPPKPKPASAAELAIVAPLTVGSHLDGWTITAIHAPLRGSMALMLTEDGKPDSLLEIDVCQQSAEGPAPPAHAGRYAIFYRGNRYDGSVSRAITEVADTIRTNDPPLLPGFSPYQTD